MSQPKSYRHIQEDEYLDLCSRILYEDNHLLIVNKRPSEIVQGDKSGDEPLSETYKAFIAQRDSKPGAVFLGVPHRLDRPVSGIVIFAKTSKALSRLCEMFKGSSVHKTYLALCCHCPDPEEGLLEGMMTRNEKLNKSFIWHKVTPPPKEAKLARLRYRLRERTQRYFLVEVHLLTGRHHQIRCQLSDFGCPIKGDLKYGAPTSNPDGSICLHSWKVSFTHPVKGEEISLTAPLPPSWGRIVPEGSLYS